MRADSNRRDPGIGGAWNPVGVEVSLGVMGHLSSRWGLEPGSSP